MSVHQDKSGWFVTYRDELGIQRKERFGHGEQSRLDALDKDDEIKSRRRRKVGLAPAASSRVYLDYVAQLYLDDLRLRDKSDYFRDRTKKLLQDHLLPLLCDRPVDEQDYTYVTRLVTRYYSKPRSKKGRASKPASPKTIQRYLGYLDAIYRFGVDKEITTKNPLAKWKRFKEQKHDSRLTVADLEKIMAHAAPHLAWAIEVLFNLGSRPGPSEIFRARWADVDWNPVKPSVTVPSSKTKLGKIKLPVSQDFRARLLEMRGQSKSPYIIEYNGRAVTSMKTAMKAAVRRAGITYHVRGLYDVRHLFATTLLSEDADLAAVSAMLGHKSVRTTADFYLDVLQGAKRQAIKGLPTLKREGAKKAAGTNVIPIKE